MSDCCQQYVVQFRAEHGRRAGADGCLANHVDNLAVVGPASLSVIREWLAQNLFLSCDHSELTWYREDEIVVHNQFAGQGFTCQAPSFATWAEVTPVIELGNACIMPREAVTRWAQSKSG